MYRVHLDAPGGPLNQDHTMCQFDCLQLRTDCLWNWCLLPSKRS